MSCYVLLWDVHLEPESCDISKHVKSGHLWIGTNWECPPHSLHFWAAARLSDVSPLIQSSVVHVRGEVQRAKMEILTQSEGIKRIAWPRSIDGKVEVYHK